MPKLSFIDLFAGCGGLSLGLMQAGWKGQFAIEKSPDAFKTLEQNLCGKGARHKFSWPSWLECGPTTTSSLLRNHKDDLLNLRGKIDLIAGGPPCQGFSTAGMRNPNDPRNRLTHEYIRIVKLVQPKYLLLENVRGFQLPFAGQKKAFSSQITKKLQDLLPVGYFAHSAMVPASIFGVPQPRQRFVMICVRKDLKDFDHCPIEAVIKAAPKFRLRKGLNGHQITAKEAIGDLEVSGRRLMPSPDTTGFQQIRYKARKRKSDYQKLMRDGVEDCYAPNSLRLTNHRPKTAERFQTILDVCEKGKGVSLEFREAHGMRKQRVAALHPNQLAFTVTTLPDDMIHYNEPRILTVRENARLQSFPDWFEFCGKYTTGGDRRKIDCPRFTQVGNAVPPLMAEAIGQTLIRMSTRHEK